MTRQKRSRAFDLVCLIAGVSMNDLDAETLMLAEDIAALLVELPEDEFNELEVTLSQFFARVSDPASTR